ncbi:MAG: PQQ-like beta-propeller repeat protein [Candidatus Coatesbacteria bacterium]|nr:PQQ-like beta-propeller repeat protein [Candidatus Coatesbacteria bacterium]
MKNLFIMIILVALSSLLFSAPGDLIWRYQTMSSVNSSPCVSDGIVYVGSSDYHLYAINSSTGSLKWRFKTDDAVWSSSCVSDGVVYVGSWDDYLYALNCSAGTLKWRYQTGCDISSSPCFSDGVVYVGSEDNYLYAINCSDGNLKWKYKTDSEISSSPCVSDGVVYVGSWDDFFYAINYSTGTLKWIIYTSDIISSSPCLSDRTVYFGSNDYCLYANGASNGIYKWRYKTGDSVWSSPCVSDGVVYVGSQDTYLYAINSSDGTLKWRYQTGNTYSSPCVSDGIVFVGSHDRYLYALQAGTVQVVLPNGGESWYCNENNNITWNATAMDSVKLFYSTDAGSNWVSIATCEDPSSGNGTYKWKIPWMETANQARIRLTNCLGNLSDNSDANFTIDVGSLTVTSPNGGEVWNIGDTQDIMWNSSTNVDSVQIEYSTDNGSSYISIERVANQSPYKWTIPDTPSEQCLVRITNTGYNKPTDVSNAEFEIRRTGFKKQLVKPVFHYYSVFHPIPSQKD